MAFLVRAVKYTVKEKYLNTAAAAPKKPFKNKAVMGGTCYLCKKAPECVLETKAYLYRMCLGHAQYHVKNPSYKIIPLNPSIEPEEWDE